MPEIENKLKFAHNFSEFLHRDWLDYSTASDAELDAFIEKHPVFMVKPVDGQCGRGIEKIDVRELTEPVREHLDGAGKVLLEECVVQHRDLMALHPCSVNHLPRHKLHPRQKNARCRRVPAHRQRQVCR